MPADVTETASHWYARPAWRPGTRYLTWFLTHEDQSGVIDLAQRTAAALAPFPTLDPIPPEWLHMTLQGLGEATQVTPDQAVQVVNATRSRLQAATIGPINATFTAPEVYEEAVGTGPRDTAPFDALLLTLRAGISDVFGACPGDARSFVPHVSLAYSNGVAPMSPIRAALRAATLGGATAHYTKVTLVELRQEQPVYRWDVVAELPLG